MRPSSPTVHILCALVSHGCVEVGPASIVYSTLARCSVLLLLRSQQQSRVRAEGAALTIHPALAWCSTLLILRFRKQSQVRAEVGAASTVHARHL